MSDSTIEKAMPRVALTRLARRAKVELNLSADAVRAVRTHVGNALGEVVRQAIIRSEGSDHKNINGDDVIQSVPNARELKGQDVKVPVCPKMPKLPKSGPCDKVKNPNCNADARKKKVSEEVKFYSTVGVCHLLPKRAFSSLVKHAVAINTKGRKISSEALSLLQSFAENAVQKTINAAGHVTVVNKKTTIRGEHVETAISVMKIGC